jgi:hypothetical protein
MTNCDIRVDQEDTEENTWTYSTKGNTKLAQ